MKRGTECRVREMNLETIKRITNSAHKFWLRMRRWSRYDKIVRYYTADLFIRNCAIARVFRPLKGVLLAREGNFIERPITHLQMQLNLFNVRFKIYEF